MLTVLDLTDDEMRNSRDHLDAILAPTCKYENFSYIYEALLSVNYIQRCSMFTLFAPTTVQG